MCLAVVAIDPSSDIALLAVGNRDEQFNRPARPAGWWDEVPGLLAGKDLDAGGTWFGVTSGGRYGVVTNHRAAARPGATESRGVLLRTFLADDCSAPAYRQRVASRLDRHGGFNLIVGTAGGSACFLSNRNDPASRLLVSGTYGLSNASIDTPWPKLTRAKDAVAHWLESPHADVDELLVPFMDRRCEPQPDTDDDAYLDLPVRLALTAAFIDGDTYGTRASTVALLRRDGTASFVERRFGPHGTPLGETRVEFQWC